MTRRSRAGPAPGVPGALAVVAGAAALVGTILLPAVEEVGGKPAPAGAAQAAVAEAPPEYRGAALPLVARDTASLLARAEEHLASGDWARGFAVLDEVLSRVTAPRGRKAVRPRPAKKETDAEATPQGPLPGNLAAEKPKDPEVDPADEVHSRDGIRFFPVADHVRRRLAELPAEARAVYRSTYEAPAREALEKAKGLPLARAFGELRRIAERYPLTAAAASSWGALSERLLGAGRPAEAARALEARLEVPGDDSTERATVLAQLAVAGLIARQPDSARRALDEVLRDHAEALVQVRGESIRGKDLAVHPFFRSLFAGAERSTASGAPGDAWVSEGGSFDHASFPVKAEEIPPLGSRARWIFPAPGPEESDGEATGRHRQLAMGYPQVREAAVRGVSFGNAAYARIGESIIALDARSGKRIWSAEPDAIQPDPQGATGNARFFNAQGMAMSSDLSLAIVPPQVTGGRALLLGIDRSPRMSQTSDGRTIFSSNLVLAFDAVTGKLLWSLEDTPREEDTEDSEGSLAFAAPPVLAGGLLVAPALKGDSLHAVGITMKGKIAWQRRLYAYNQAYYMRYGFEMSAGSSFASRAGIVAAASGHGIACVLDAASGAILWESRYRSDLRVSGHSGQFVFFDSSRSRPPIIAGDLFLVFPPDGDHVTAFDLRSGEIRWERRMGAASGQFLLGADSDRAYVAGEKVRALRMADGTDAWEQGPIGPPSITSGVVATGRILVAAGAARLAAIDAETGKIASEIRIFDQRIASNADVGLFLARGEILAAVGGRVIALERQDASWKALGENEELRLHERSRLLRAEGRHAEAIAALDRLRARVRSEELRESIEKDIVLAARAAAEGSGKASFITELLSRADPIVKDRREVIALRLQEASLLEKQSERAAATRIYGELVKLEGFLATSPDGFEVDVGTYAADALAVLRATGVDAADPDGEARARAILAGRPGAAALSRILLRRAHLDAASDAAMELAFAAEKDGDPWRSREILLLAVDGATPGARDALAKRLAAAPDPAVHPHDPAPGGADPVPGLAEVLDAARGKPLRKSFWLSSEEGFLAATAPGSLPLPVLMAIAKTSVRVYGADGKLLLERALPDYPDVSDLKISLQSHLEEPAVARAYDDHVVLFTAAGLYDFVGIGATSASVQPRDIKLRWTSTWSHTFAEMAPSSRRFGWGGIALAQGENTFPELGEMPRGEPVVLFRDGTLVAFDDQSGKRLSRSPSEGYGAASPPVVKGASIAVTTARPPGITLHRADGRTGDGDARRTSRLVPGTKKNISRAFLAAGGLVAAFSGEGIEVIEVETGRPLWSRGPGSSAIVHATSSELWLAEPGKLVCRSIRSGRERRTIPLPEGASVVDVLDHSGGSRETTLIVSRGASARAQYWGYYSRSETGTDLHVITIDSERRKAREVEVHKGAVTYDGGHLLASGGRLVLFFNGATEPEKWYTRAVLIEPGGEVKEVLTAELQGKGTGQPPRLAVLRGGLGVGNSGGFGWFAPGGDGAPDGGVGPSPPPGEGAGASTKEPEGR